MKRRHYGLYNIVIIFISVLDFLVVYIKYVCLSVCLFNLHCLSLPELNHRAASCKRRFKSSPLSHINSYYLPKESKEAEKERVALPKLIFVSDGVEVKLLFLRRQK